MKRNKISIKKYLSHSQIRPAAFVNDHLIIERWRKLLLRIAGSNHQASGVEPHLIFMVSIVEPQ
ncbi:MAG: hypothetical protein M3Q95_08720 [Bacteroidota bacterium]|nr:hypothetical protein [Bacteroidota bacterium]